MVFMKRKKKEVFYETEKTEGRVDIIFTDNREIKEIYFQ